MLRGLSGKYSLFFAAGLQSASFSSNGSVDFDVMYATVGSSMDLLRVALDSSGAYASSPSLMA